jgi:dTDP-4-dehydrorhamnose 3,5-epimerase
MKTFMITRTAIPAVIILSPARFGDDRGFFSETWSRPRLQALGIDIDFVQDNHSLSVRAGTLRGLHYQAPPHAQDKLVRCTRGAILDVAVDIRCGSPSYGQAVTVELTAENGLQLLVPRGFLHGFVTRAENTEVQYKCSDIYAPACDGAVRWDSAGIDWGLPKDMAGDPVLSAKDAAAPAFDTFQSPFVYEAP